jgi:shikimate kinase
MRVVLFGMKHCGKTTVGKELARIWDCPFYDVDVLIENAFKTEECLNMSVWEILTHYGEEGFNKREERAVFDLFKKLRGADAEDLRMGRPISDYVISLGGRTPLNAKLQSIVKRLGLNIFLRIAPREAWRRVVRSGIPSFLTSSQPEKEFMELYRKREPLYEKQADLTISLDGLGRRASLRRLIESLEERGYARQ